jgi:glycosyltransferase involved in cell wall biosynthesis
MAPSSSICRVLYIDHTAELGGGEIALLNLIRKIDRQKIYPVVLLFSEGPLAERLRPLAETLILPLRSSVGKASKDSLGVGSLLKLSAIWIVLLHIFRVRRIIRTHRIQLVHTNSLKADLIGGIAARLAGIPVVWHVRDRIERDYLPRPVVFSFRLLCRYIPDFVIANSQATLQTLHLPEKCRCAAIFSGTDVEAISVKKNSGTNSSVASGARRKRMVHIGLIGRISPWKGQHIFIRAASLLHSRFPNVRFQIIGAPLFSEREYEREMHQLRAELGVKEVVEFVGFVEDISARIAALDMVVHASTTGEPFGQVIVEGMAAEKAVVATRGGGVLEIVEDGVTGLLVPMGDPEAMAKGIEYLLINPKEAQQMGKRGRERVLKHFSIERTVEKVAQVYAEVLTGVST